MLNNLLLKLQSKKTHNSLIPRPKHDETAVACFWSRNFSFRVLSNLHRKHTETRWQIYRVLLNSQNGLDCRALKWMYRFVKQATHH